MIPRTFNKFILACIACIACIAFIAVTCSAVSCNSADRPTAGNEGATTEWREVMTFSPVNLGPPAWCGKDAMVLKELEFHPETNSQTGGIVHIDLASKKKTWIERDPMNKTPSCSHDGSIVFYVKLHDDEPQAPSDGTGEINNEDDGSLGKYADGVWAYDLSTGKKRKIAQIDIDYMEAPASPAGKVFAMVPRQKSHLKRWKIDLPGWKLVPFPATDEERNCGGYSQWSTSGKLLVFDTESPQDGRHYAFYDANGALIRRLSDTRMNSKGNVKALDDGLYFFRKDGQFMRFDPWADKLEEMPFKIEIRKRGYFWFDVSPRKEIAYIRHDSNGELWIYSLVTKQHQRLGSKEPVTSFSPDGKYLGIVTQNISGKDSIAIMQRLER